MKKEIIEALSLEELFKWHLIDNLGSHRWLAAQDDIDSFSKAEVEELIENCFDELINEAGDIVIRYAEDIKEYMERLIIKIE